MPIPPNETYRVDLHYVLQGLQMQNVLHFLPETAPISEAETIALALAAETWMTTEVMPHLSLDLVLTQVVVSGYQAGGLAFQASRSPNQAGGRLVESPEPAQVACVITWRTALPQKSGRGRMYIPGPSSTDIGGAGQVFDPLHAGLEDAAQKAIDETYFGTMTLGVWSRTDSLVRPVTGFTVQDQVRTQRRRLR